MTDEHKPSTSHDRHSLVGTVLAGRYRILGVLGWGGMGTVYLAEHVKIGRRTAIKVLHASDHDPGSVARFVRGARNAARIDHPNVCRVFDFGDPPGGMHFLAMELIEGESLLELLDRETRLDVDSAIDIGRQIARALQAAHDIGIVHRDLKPGNIMLAPGRGGRPMVKVVDFDIAKDIVPRTDREVTTFGWLVGTPEYMSPEQFLGGDLDGRSDVYSLGVILFRMLTGRFPITAKGGDPQEIMRERLHREPLSLEAVGATGLPDGLQAVLDRALSRSLDGRWPNAEAVDGALGRLAAGQSPIPPAPVPPEPYRGGSDVPMTVTTQIDGIDGPETENDTRPDPPASGTWRRVAAGLALLTGVVVAGFGVRAALQPDAPPTSVEQEAESPPNGSGGGTNPADEVVSAGQDDPVGPDEDGSSNRDPVRPEPVEDEGRSAGAEIDDPGEGEEVEQGSPAMTAEAATSILDPFEMILFDVDVGDHVLSSAERSDMLVETIRIYRDFEGRFDEPGAREVAAYAAYVTAWIYTTDENESTQALEWAQLAVDLNSEPSYRTLLESIRGGGVGWLYGSGLPTIGTE